MGGGKAVVRGLRAPLLRWYRRHRRDLPWRRTRDPYAIWVAEIMLQQTRVATVIPYYERFMRRFPDATRLAQASEDDVLSLWSGLGYYRRARALHAGARDVVARHGGRLPADGRTLQGLPGIGRYTAGAIASIGFGLAEPVLDGNVRRVLARLFAVGGGALSRADEARQLWELAGRLVQGPDPGDLNQALMELGASVCSARDPRCTACPVARRCRALDLGRPEEYPVARPRGPTRRVRVAVAWIHRSGDVLLERPSGQSPLRGVWDLPAVELEGNEESSRALRVALERRHDLTLSVDPAALSASHGIMNRRLQLELHSCRLRKGRVAGRAGLRWFDASDPTGTPVSGATLKLARLMQATVRSPTVASSRHRSPADPPLPVGRYPS